MTVAGPHGEAKGPAATADRFLIRREVDDELRSVEHLVDDRWLLAYAVAVGEERREAVDLDTPGGIVAHPVFPVCIEWPLISAGAPGVSLSPGTLEKGLHVIHRIRHHRPIRAGDVLRTSCQLATLEQRSVGAYLAVRFESCAADGGPVVSTYLGMLYRGVEPVGAGPRHDEGPDRMVVSEPLFTVGVINVDRRNAVVYTECARIWNPIHTDIRVARAGGLPDTVLHGTECLARAATAVLGYLPPEYGSRISKVESTFGAVVTPGTRLTVKVSELSKGASWAALAFEVLTEAGVPAIKDGYLEFDLTRGGAVV